MLCLASEMNSFTSDQLHVAQQSRREKLRIQHCSPSRPCHRVDDYSSGLEVVQPDINPDMVQTGDDMRNNVSLMYRPAEGPSEILTFSSTLCNDSIHGTMRDQASVVNSVNLVSSMADNSLKPGIEDNLVKCGVWKSVSSNSNADNWSADCLGRYKKNNSVGIVGDISGFEMRAKNNTSVHRQSQFQYGDMNYASQIQYQNALSDGVTTAVLGSHPNFNVTGGSCTSWGSYGGDNEHVHNAPYGYQFDGCVPSSAIWTAEMSSLQKRTDQAVVDSYSQGLSLSLCSYPAGSLITGSQIGNPHVPQSIPLHNVASIAFQDSKPCSPNFRMTAGGGHDYSLQESVGPSTNYHHQAGPGPLGPFTGYATILKSSRFLQPAQQLLDEYCGVIAKYASSSTGDGDIGDLATAVNSIVSDAGTTGDIAGVSVATRQESNDVTNEATTTNSSIKSLRPDYQAKKAKLLYMLEEVSRRYRQYYQQMQMVVSAFESVAGLAGATPCISSALKTISRHFNHLKNAISDQLRHIKNFLGEDFSVPSSGIRVEGGVNNKRLKYADHSFQKHKSLGNNMGLLEPQQHIWRPQRGLPERAVSVLRAWLFEHFLHPYPTDTDKHMLAAQTGLTRSQVSNWFINARVRLWKPMVEEVHMLETKGAAERTNNVVENDVSTNEVDDHLKSSHPLVKMAGSSIASVNLKCPAALAMYEMGNECVAKQCDHENQSQVESHHMSSVEGMLGISQYHQTRYENIGTGSISLTLGLRQSADQMYRLDGSQQPTYIQQQDRVRQHFGGHTTHEYSG